MEPDKAQALITEVARHAIGEFFAEEFPGKAYKIKATGWPRVHTIIVDHLAIIEIDLGLEWKGRHRIEPVKIRAQLEDETWDARPAIRAVLRRGEIPNGIPEGGLKARPDMQSPRTGVSGTTTHRAGGQASEKSKRPEPNQTSGIAARLKTNAEQSGKARPKRTQT